MIINELLFGSSATKRLSRPRFRTKTAEMTETVAARSRITNGRRVWKSASLSRTPVIFNGGGRSIREPNQSLQPHRSEDATDRLQSWWGKPSMLGSASQ